MNCRSQKSTIIFFGKLPPPYIGPSIATEIILQSKITEEFKVIHFNTSDHRPIQTLARFDFINIWLSIKQYLQLLIYLVKYNPDLVYIPAGQTKIGYIRDSIFIIISLCFCRKIICHLRGGNFHNFFSQSSRIMKWYIRIVHSRVTGQIVLGNNLKHMFNQILPDNKIFVVPNGGNYNFPKTRKPEIINILYLSNFIKTKGILDVLKAFTLLREYDNIQLQLVGDWNDDYIKREVENFVSQNYHLPIIINGTKSGVAKFKILSLASIFIFPTYYINEGHPWSIVEAMAAGLPIISTNHAAIPESVIDGLNGFIVEKQNPSQIAEKMQFLIDHPEIREKMGKSSRKLYEENFTEEKMTERFINVFNQVINSK